ncbi:MAG TPA: ABC transporter substrate-binding protein [bacterium]|nr:ABC transporter substrate-binding protein [bacterium]
MRRAAALTATAMLLAVACKTPPVSTSAPDPRGGLDAREAPMLHDRVARGELPPLENRLPADPLVVTPAEQPGLYGGTWRMMVDRPTLEMYKIIGGYASLIRWKPDDSGIAPGIATSWEFDSTGRELTLHLRHGVKWSDGVDFTSDDLVYWWGVVLDGRSRLIPPVWSRAGGAPMTVSAPDAWTLVMHFAGPNWHAPLNIATTLDFDSDYFLPRHYLEQFDPRANKSLPDFTTFDQKNKTHLNPDRPTLWPWKLDRIEEGGLRARFVRNPYYWMMDDLGRQLPYIDRVDARVVDDVQLRVMRILAGDVDAQFRLADILDSSLLEEGKKRGGYRLLRWSDGSGAMGAFWTDWSSPDPVLRELFRDKRFRRGLSLAIDREKINQIRFRGLAHAQGATISRESWHFRSPRGQKILDAWASAYAQFDLPRANALLDEIGLPRGADGIRRRRDGAPLRLLIDSTGNASSGDDEVDVILDGWRALGIDATVRYWPLATWYSRQNTSAYDVSNGVMAEMDLLTYPDWIFPTSQGIWHGAVGKWYESGGKEGEPPTGVQRQLLDLYEKIQREPDLDRANDLVLDAIQLHIDEGPFILGTAADPPALVVIRNNFHNVPTEPRVLGAWAAMQPGASFPETFYFSPESEAR